MTSRCYQPMDICLRAGLGWQDTIQVFADRKAYRTVESATPDAPCVLSVTGHGVPDNWPVRITGAQGLTELNTVDGWIATRLTDDTIEINALNARQLDPYVAQSGTLEYDEPRDLTGVQATQVWYAKQGGEPVLTTTSGDGDIGVDAGLAVVVPALTAGQVATLKAAFCHGWHSLVIVDAAGALISAAAGMVHIDG